MEFLKVFLSVFAFFKKCPFVAFLRRFVVSGISFRLLKKTAFFQKSCKNRVRNLDDFIQHCCGPFLFFGVKM